jgi:hypothetical protein
VGRKTRCAPLVAAFPHVSSLALQVNLLDRGPTLQEAHVKNAISQELRCQPNAAHILRLKLED